MDLVEVPTLETERLRLRSFRRRDTDDYASLRADPEVLRYLLGAGGQPWDRGRSWRHMAFLIGHWKLAGVGRRLGETLQGHVNLNGHEMLCYGIDREIYTAQATPALSLAHPS